MEESITKTYAGSREFALDFPLMVDEGWFASKTTTSQHTLSHRLLGRLRPKANARPEPKVVVVYRRGEPGP